MMPAVAVRGLQAYAVPSAQAGQHTDPAARRDALSGLLAAGFLLAVIAVVLAIVLAAPEYGEPATDGQAAGVESDGTAADALLAEGAAGPATESQPSQAMPASPTSLPPDKLKGYRWPVRGGMVASYYDWQTDGPFVIDGRRMHAGLAITWFEGALVKAAHAGTVLAAGREWASEAGYDGPLDELHERQRRKGDDGTLGIVIDDGNGYRSVYSALQDLRVSVGEKVKAGTVIGAMSRSEGQQMMRYQLVRMDGPWLKVALTERQRGYPDYAREYVDPLAVLRVGAPKSPDTVKRPPPAEPPRLSEY
jgi:murein DD-endopeptidase MepM/ murein hydrolase activator NlpD